MRTSICLGMGLAFVSMCLVAEARPVVFEEKAKLTAPDPAYPYLSHVAIDGNHLLVFARAAVVPETGDYYAVFHFERQGDGSWLSRGKIDGLQYQDVGAGYSDLEFRGGIAVFAAEHRGVHVLERDVTGWTVTDIAGDGSIPGDMTSEVRIVGSTIALAARDGGQCAINLVRKNAQGVWSLADQIVSDDESCLWGDFDVLGPAAIEYTGPQALISNGLAYIYDQINGVWTPTPLQQTTQRSVVIGTEIALRAGAARDKGDILYLDRRNASGQWTVRDTLRSEESYANVAPGQVIVRGNRAITGAPNNDIRGENSGSVNILDRDSSSRFTHVATLLSSDGTYLGAGGVAATQDGRTIAVSAVDTSGKSAVYLYELPSTLPQATRVQDNFEDVNAAGWTPFGATNWSVIQANGSYVYRQSNVQGDARSILGSPTTQNQSIEADLKLNTFGSTSWAGLMTRYTDSLNFYYLMIWNNQTVQIRNMRNGSFSALASAPFSPVVGRTYRLRLEAVGTLLRAYVDGNLVLQARDTSHAAGQAGLTMWKTNADYDNVIVSTSPATELLLDGFSQTAEEQLTPWTTSPQNAWSYVNASGATVLRQSQLDVTARAINGAPAGDQIVTADIRPLSFHASGTPFAGLIARYVDSGSYYYVLLNKANTVSLRKLANGAITVLDEVPMTVQPGTSYRVRFEAIGDSLRLYVNGKLMAEAQDSTYPTGRYGLATYRSTAQYDNFSATRP